MLTHSYAEQNGSDARLAAKRLAGVTPEVNIREHGTCIPPASANKAAHSGFETQRRCHQQKSKTWVSVARQKRLMSSKFFFYSFKSTFYLWFPILFRKKLNSKNQEKGS